MQHGESAGTGVDSAHDLPLVHWVVEVLTSVGLAPVEELRYRARRHGPRAHHTRCALLPHTNLCLVAAGPIQACCARAATLVHMSWKWS